MSKSLIIGDTSQLSFYFPKSYHRVSSRNIDINRIKESKYDSVYITFAEQRTFLKLSEEDYCNVNVNYTLNLIDQIKNHVNKVVVYSTSELWNNYNGAVSIYDKYNYNYSPYIKSKEILSEKINEKKHEYENVHIVYPFNFNSPIRKTGFLFYKIFDSLINKKINNIGNINFLRDIIHPSIIVKESINTKKDKLVGSGELINIEYYVSEIFDIHNMNYKDYLLFDVGNNLKTIRNNYYSSHKYSNYDELIILTKKDIDEY